MLRRCELLCADNTNKTLYFKHRTFAEFFYARGMMKRAPVVDQKAFQLYWMNTYFFYVGLQKDCPELLLELIDLEPKSDFQRWLKMINMPMFFLAGYASEYDVIETGITAMMHDAARFYSDVIHNRIDTPLSDFSQMQVLCIMQSLIKKSYSYKFFKPALEQAALRIADTETDKEMAAAALFFLSVINIELEEGGENAFDFLLEKYINELPLAIQLGIRHEEGHLKERSVLLKRLEKRFSKFIAASTVDKNQTAFYASKKAAFDEKIDALYEKPLKLLKIT